MDLAEPSKETEEDNPGKTEVEPVEEKSEDEDTNDIEAETSIEETGIQKEEYSAIPDDQEIIHKTLRKLELMKLF